jgi:hypothetical protein
MQRKRVNHSRAATRETRAAILDVTSGVFPKFGEARHFVGTVKHTQKALYHGQKALKSKINRFKRNLGL